MAPQHETLVLLAVPVGRRLTEFDDGLKMNLRGIEYRLIAQFVKVTTMTHSTIDLLLTRRSVLAANLVDPGPGSDDLDKILRAAIRVPDHGRAEPWRIQILHKPAQRKLGELCKEIFARENSGAADALIEAEQERPQRSPLLLVVTFHPNPEKFAKVPEVEQKLSCAAVCQNLLIAAQALSFSAQWVTDWPAYHADVRAALGHNTDTEIVGFIHLGTASAAPKERPRPEFTEIVSEWTPSTS
jgi:nitroreductase